MPRPKVKHNRHIYLIIGLVCVSFCFLAYMVNRLPSLHDALNKSHPPASISSQKTINIKPKKVAPNDIDDINKVTEYLKNSENNADYVRNQSLRMVRIQYNSALSRLSLSREDAIALMELLAEKSAVAMEIRNVSTLNEQHSKSISAEAEGALRIEMQRDLDVEIKNLLGKEKYNILRDTALKFPFYNFSNSLADSFSYTNEPLSSEQINKITDFISEHAQIDDIRTSYYYDILLAAPDDLLTPGQKARISRLQREEDEIRRLKADLSRKK